MSISIHDWTPDDLPDNAAVVEALTANGVDPDAIDATPEGVWYVDDRGLCLVWNHNYQWWNVYRIGTTSLVAYGTLGEVAAVIGEMETVGQ